MLKRQNGKKINPDTCIYTLLTFKLVKHNADMDEEYIYIRVAIENRRAFFINIWEDGQYGLCQFATYDTFRTTFDNTFTAYECEVDNIDVEYH